MDALKGRSEEMAVVPPLGLCENTRREGVPYLTLNAFIKNAKIKSVHTYVYIYIYLFTFTFIYKPIHLCFYLLILFLISIYLYIYIYSILFYSVRFSLYPTILQHPETSRILFLLTHLQASILSSRTPAARILKTNQDSYTHTKIPVVGGEVRQVLELQLKQQALFQRGRGKGS